MNVNSKKIKIFFQLLGPIIFIYILFRIDFQFIFERIKLVKWPFLILAVCLIIIDIIIRSLRWRTVLSSLDINISKIACLNLYWLGLFVGILTPGRFGELIKVYFLKIKGYKVFRSFFSIILDRLSDVFVLLLFGLLIFLFFLKDIGIYIILFGIVLILIIIFLFLLIDKKSYLHKIFGKFIQKVFPFDFNDYNHFTFSKFWQGIKTLKRKEIIYFSVYLVLSWVFYFLAKYSVSLALGLSLSFIEIAIISSLVAIVVVLPISIAGLGTREVSIIYLFSLFGLNREVAFLFSLLVFTIDTLVVSVGIIPYLKESSLINKVKSHEFK